MTRKQTHKKILRELGPQALEVYKALESMADSNGCLVDDPVAIRDRIMQLRKEQQCSEPESSDHR